MNEMINYVFGSLRTSENAVKNINKTLRTQTRINRSIANFALIAAVYMILAEINDYGQNKKIEKLSDEIEELKRMKGA